MKIRNTKWMEEVEIKYVKIISSEPLSYENYRTEPTEIKILIPCWEELQVLNDLRKSKLKSDDVTIRYEHEGINLKVKLVSGVTLHESEIELQLNTPDYITTMIEHLSLELIKKETDILNTIPLNYEKDYKKIKHIANLIIMLIIEKYKYNSSKDFPHYYRSAANYVLYNKVTNEDYIFLDLSNLKEIVKYNLPNFGYIIVNNKLKEL